MTPQRDTHWDIIADIYDQLRAENPRKRLKSDVRIDYPGHLNGFASDVTLLAEGATKNDKGRWRCEDVVFIAEVISQKTADNDYGPKKDAYATAGVPVYLIVDPYSAEWHLHTLPQDGVYHAVVSFPFGQEVDLTRTAVGLVLKTDEFPAADHGPRPGGYAAGARAFAWSRGTKRTVGWPWCQRTVRRRPAGAGQDQADDGRRGHRDRASRREADAGAVGVGDPADDRGADGAPPRNTIMYRAMTRPRTAGSVDIWRLVLVVTLTVIDTRPSGTMISANIHSSGDAAARISSAPKASAARISSRSRAVPRRAASRAPETEPTAISVLNML